MSAINPNMERAVGNGGHDQTGVIASALPCLDPLLVFEEFREDFGVAVASAQGLDGLIRKRRLLLNEVFKNLNL